MRDEITITSATVDSVSEAVEQKNDGKVNQMLDIVMHQVCPLTASFQLTTLLDHNEQETGLTRIECLHCPVCHAFGVIGVLFTKPVKYGFNK